MKQGSGNGKPRTTERRRRGDVAEAAALATLLRAGLEEVARNVGFRGGELDLVMRDGDTLVFVEVRYRRHVRFGGGAASVDAGKRRRLARAAQLFLMGHRRHASLACRFDVVAADGDPEQPRITWIRDAFRLGDAY